MSYEYQARKNKQQKHPKVDFQEYLYNSDEPADNIFSDSPASLEAKLLENTHFMRRRFRHIAQDIRNRYS